MKKIKSFLSSSKIKPQNGVIGILTLLIVAGLSSTAYGFHKLVKGAKKYQETKLDVTQVEIASKEDFGKEYIEDKAKFTKVIVEGGETALKSVIGSTCDDVGLLTIADELGAFNVPEKQKTKEQKEKEAEQKLKKKQKKEKIEEELKKKKLPADSLMQDVAQRITDVVKKNASANTNEKEIDKVVTEVLQGLAANLDRLETEKPTEKPEVIKTKEKTEKLSWIMNTIKKTLNINNSLATEKEIANRDELNKANFEKEYLEKKIAVYENYEKQGYMLTNTTEWTLLKGRLDNLNKKISNLSIPTPTPKPPTPTSVPTSVPTPIPTSIPEFPSPTSASIPTGSITLRGSGKLAGLAGTDRYSITMTINLDTGRVTGSTSASGSWLVNFQIYDVDTGEKMDVQAKYCSAKYRGYISGKLNLTTRSIVASGSDKVSTTATSGDCSTVKDVSGSTTLTGRLNASYSYASGVDSDGSPWSVSR